MRVALVALHFAEYSAHLAAALAERNDVLLILYRENVRNELGERLGSDFLHPRLRVLILNRPTNIWGVFLNVREIALAIRQFNPEVLHLQEELRDELVLALQLVPRCPRLLTVHDPVNHSGVDAERFRFSRHRLYRILVRRSVDRVLTHGIALVNELVAQLPHLRGRIHSVPHGPLGPTGDLRIAPPLVRGRFLFFGRLHEYKGLRYFVDAIQRLHQAGLPVLGVVAGRGADLASNRQMMNHTPSAFEVIERYIPTEEVRQLFSEATAAVLPYVDGTQSGVAAMAVGFGRPAIASRVGSIPELVRDGVNGILVSPRDVDALASAMASLLLDPLRWRALANGALGLRSGELSWRSISESTEAIYLEAIRNQTP